MGINIGWSTLAHTVRQPNQIEQAVCKLFAKVLLLVRRPIWQPSGCAGVTLPLEALGKLANFAHEGEANIPRCVELIPIAFYGKGTELLSELCEVAAAVLRL